MSSTSTTSHPSKKHQSEPAAAHKTELVQEDFEDETRAMKLGEKAENDLFLKSIGAVPEPKIVTNQKRSRPIKEESEEEAEQAVVSKVDRNAHQYGSLPRVRPEVDNWIQGRDPDFRSADEIKSDAATEATVNESIADGSLNERCVEYGWRSIESLLDSQEASGYFLAPVGYPRRAGYSVRPDIGLRFITAQGRLGEEEEESRRREEIRQMTTNNQTPFNASVPAALTSSTTSSQPATSSSVDSNLVDASLRLPETDITTHSSQSSSPVAKSKHK